MSAPETNVHKQEKRHRPALSGIAIALIAVVLIAIAVALFVGLPRSEQAAPNPTTPPAVGSATE